MTKFLEENVSKVIVALLIWIVTSSGTAVWWAASVSSELKYLRESVTAAREDRYFGKDAQRDFALRDIRISQNAQLIEKEIAEVKAGVVRIEQKIDRQMKWKGSE